MEQQTQPLNLPAFLATNTGNIDVRTTLQLFSHLSMHIVIKENNTTNILKFNCVSTIPSRLSKKSNVVADVTEATKDEITGTTELVTEPTEVSGTIIFSALTTKRTGRNSTHARLQIIKRQVKYIPGCSFDRSQKIIPILPTGFRARNSIS